MLRCNIHATSFRQFAVAADFVRIGYLSAVWGRPRCQNMPQWDCNEARRRSGGGCLGERGAGHTYAMHHCQRGWEFKARKGKRRERSEKASEPTIRYSMCPDGHCCCPLKRGRCAYNVSRSTDHGTVCLSIDQVGIDKAVKCKLELAQYLK